MSVSAKTISTGLIDSIKTNPKQSDTLVEACVAFLQQNNLLALAPTITKHLERFSKEELRFETLRITASDKLSVELEQGIRTSLEVDQKALTEYQIESEMTGGILAEYRGKILDTSIETILNRLTHSLTA